MSNPLLAASVVAAVAGAASAALPPSYEEAVIHARSSAGSSFNFPTSVSSFSDLDLANDGGITFRGYRYVNYSGTNSIWYGTVQDGGQVVSSTSDDVKKLNLAADGTPIWFKRGSTANTGFFTYENGAVTKVANAGGPAFNVGVTTRLQSGDILHYNSAGNDTLYRIDPVLGIPAPYFSGDTSGHNGFTPSSSFSHQGELSMVGFGFSGGKELLRVAADGSVTTVAATATEFGGAFSGISNTTRIASNGTIAFQATPTGGSEGIFIADTSGTTTLIATRDIASPLGLASIASFGADVNAHGIALFRATGIGNSTEGLWIGDGVSLLEVIGVGDEITTDLGVTTITGLGGFAINDDNTILFEARLASGGVGVFSIVAVPTPGAAGALAMGGLLAVRRRR